MPRWAILCRATSDQLHENAHAPVWPSICSFRRVAALAILAHDVRVSTPGCSSRLTANQTPATGDTAAGDGRFPGLLAGMVAKRAAAAGLARSGEPSRTAPKRRAVDMEFEADAERSSAVPSFSAVDRQP